MFLLLTLLICLTQVLAVLLAYARHRDPFHPQVVLAPMILFIYTFVPLYLYLTQREELLIYLPYDVLVFAQSINLLGTLAITLGVFAGSRQAAQAVARPWSLDHSARSRLDRAGKILAFCALLGFAYGIAYVGGLSEAYGRRYGGGWAESGYIRELFLLGLPAALLIMLARGGRRFRLADIGWILLAVSPILVHGVLGARRGPTFMALSTLGVGWYLMHGRRPALVSTALAGLTIGFVLLFLVANRDQVYIGSSFDQTRSSTDSYVFTVNTGNDFIFSSAWVYHAYQRSDYRMGRGYIITFLVRPIPKEIWPTKYEDAIRIMGLYYDDTIGDGYLSFDSTLGWDAAVGSAPSIVTDTWVELSWGFVMILFVLGWIFGRGWLLACQRNGLYLILYVVMIALSLYLVMQGVEAFGFRFILLGLPTWLAWRIATPRSRQPTARSAITRSRLRHVPSTNVSRANVPGQLGRTM
jgi:hypothetical protein